MLSCLGSSCVFTPSYTAVCCCESSLCVCPSVNPSNKSGSLWCFQSLLCGGKGSYPHRSVLVFWVLVALQNQLKNHQKVANAWRSLPPRNVSLAYPASVSISLLMACAWFESGGGRQWQRCSLLASLCWLHAAAEQQVHDQPCSRISSALPDHQHPAPRASLEQSIELLGLAGSWGARDVPGSAPARVI